MSHDRGCPCGRERWDYRECADANGERCMRRDTVRGWDAATQCTVYRPSIHQMWRDFYKDMAL